MIDIRIPIRLLSVDNDGFHIMVSLEVNGLHANAIVDTGASRTVLDINRVSYYLGDTELRQNDRSVTGIGSVEVSSRMVVLPSIQLSTLILRDIEMVAIDLGAVNKAYAVFDLPRIDMVLGGDILERLQAVIDYKNRLLVISKT